jgi:hypothetical protein
MTHQRPGEPTGEAAEKCRQVPKGRLKLAPDASLGEFNRLLGTSVAFLCDRDNRTLSS